MHCEQVTEEVLYTRERVTTVRAGDVELLLSRAVANQRRRVRLCAHPDPGDKVHEMLIVHSRGNFVPPHRHVNKSESFHLIQGELDVVLFTEQGEISDLIEMGDLASGKVFFYRLAPGIFHTVIIRSEMVVFHETTNGPFVRQEMEFASWAPSEGDRGAAEYLERVSCLALALRRRGAGASTGEQRS